MRITPRYLGALQISLVADPGARISDSRIDEDVEDVTMPKPRRTAAKLIRYTPDELQLVVDRARDCGRPVACYIRETSLGTTPRAQRAQRSAELIRHLTRLGNRLVALAQAARERQLPNAIEFEAELAALLDVIRQIE